MSAASLVRVAVNGSGVIGKRVADAVVAQDDMTLAGVADVNYDYRVRVAADRGYPVVAALDEARHEMEAAGIPVVGTLDEPVARADIVIDCTPKGAASKNKQRYEAAGVEAISRGGAQHELAGYSFVAWVNYAGNR